uniref:Uncharacterized protein n=1 Tax=Ditylenchus dipsaci TaxID=166011 RepID=A0A915EN44_9BILA
MERFGQVNFGALSQVLGMDPNVLMQICQNSVRQPAPIAAAPVVQVVEEAVQENSDEDDYYSSEEEPAVNVFGPIRLAEFRRQKIQKLYDHAYEQCIAGYSAPRKRKIYLDADKRILSLVLLFERRNLIEYLRGLARNFIMDQ